MTGPAASTGAGADPDRSARRPRLDDGDRLLFGDVRRFGTGVVLLGTGTLEDYFSGRLGVEPLGLDFTAEALRTLVRGGGGRPVKAFLLSQERIAGGATSTRTRRCFPRAHTSATPGRHPAPAQLEALREGVIASLEAGIDAKGATIDDFRHADGARGTLQDRFLVHTREGDHALAAATRSESARRRSCHLGLGRLQPRPRAARRFR